VETKEQKGRVGEGEGEAACLQTTQEIAVGSIEGLLRPHLIGPPAGIMACTSMTDVLTDAPSEKSACSWRACRRLCPSRRPSRSFSAQFMLCRARARTVLAEGAQGPGQGKEGKREREEDEEVGEGHA